MIIAGIQQFLDFVKKNQGKYANIDENMAIKLLFSTDALVAGSVLYSTMRARSAANYDRQARDYIIRVWNRLGKVKDSDLHQQIKEMLDNNEAIFFENADASQEINTIEDIDVLFNN